MTRSTASLHGLTVRPRDRAVTWITVAGLVAGALDVASAGAQTTPPKGQPPSDGTRIVITDGSVRSQVRLAFPESTYDASISAAVRDAAAEVEQTLRDDLEYDHVFNVQGPAELAILTFDGRRDHDFEQMLSVGNEVVLETTLRLDGDRLVLDGWIYDLRSGQSVLGKRFRGTADQARSIAHHLADAIHHQFTGEPGIALTSIAFHSDRDGHQELYLMDYDGRNQRRISGHQSTSGYPDWSATGDAIAYMSYFSSTPALYYVDIASGNKVPIYGEGTLTLSPSFAPDGQRLAFSHGSSNTDIYVCERSCSSPLRLTRSAAIDTNPSWSPNGDQIAFTSSRSGRPNIYVMSTEGTDVRRISFEGNYNDGANWSPDGTHLVYASREGHRFRIAETNLVDLETQILAQGPDSYEEPSYSPDGRRISFTLKRGAESQVYVMNRDGSAWRQLTQVGRNAAPDWSWFPQN